MGKLKVINVGQGDSFILSPDAGCDHKDFDIFVDVGGGKDVSSYSNQSKKKIIMLSHSHKDHIGGLVHFLGSANINDIEEIWLPLYFDEINKITEFILNLDGIDKLAHESHEVKKAESIITSASLINNLVKLLKINVRGLSEGNELCNHMFVFNPPIEIEQIIGIERHRLDGFIQKIQDDNYELIRQSFSGRYANEIISFLRGETIFREMEFTDNQIPLMVPNIINSEQLPIENRIRFIYGVLYLIEEDILKFVRKPLESTLNKILGKIKLTSNNASVVFSYHDTKLDVLFTGDIERSGFNRILKRYDLKHEILKVPHHGSRKSISKTILKKVKPKYAIVSHGNRRFGRSTDSHPNKEVVQWLDELKVDTLYTNDVIKNAKVTKTKPSSVNFCSGVEFHE